MVGRRGCVSEMVEEMLEGGLDVVEMCGGWGRERLVGDSSMNAN
jgi:hypothetical protein